MNQYPRRANWAYTLPPSSEMLSILILALAASFRITS